MKFRRYLFRYVGRGLAMIHVINPENRHLYGAELIEQHRLRHAVYIVERKWRGIEDRGGLEYDRYDTDETTYLLAIEDNRVIGGTRLFPTLRPHMLEEVCPQLAAVQGIPRAPDILEWTRIYVSKDRREGAYGGAIAGQLFSATFEYCLELGVSALNVVFEAWWLPRLTAQGWKMKPLGVPDMIDGDWWMAVTLPLDEETLRATRAYNKIDGEILVWRGIQRRKAIKVA